MTLYSILCRRELRGLLGVLFVLVGNAVTSNADQNLSANWVETLLVGHETLRNYRGGVVYADSVRNLVVKADSAHVRVEDAVYLFLQKVSYQDSIREISADTLVFYEHRKLATFGGQVMLRDKDRAIRARAVRFLYEKELLDAKGGVSVNLSSKRSLSSTSLHYNLPLEKGQVFGNAELVVSERGHDTLIAKADSIAFTKSGEELFLDGGVHLSQGKTQSGSQSATYIDSIVVLLGEPFVSWVSTHLQDSVSVTSGKIQMTLPDQRLSQLILSDSTLIRSKAWQDSTSNTQLIRADSARITFVDNTPQLLYAWGNVRLDLGARDSAIATISGKSLTMAYVEGRPDSMVFAGPCLGRYFASDGLSESHLGAKSFLLWFERGHLVEMSLKDEAYCTRVTQAGGDVSVSGDFLELSFQEGELAHIEAEGAVKGHYRAETEAGQ